MSDAAVFVLDLLENIKDRFTRTICNELAKTRPAVCLSCVLVVGCEQCHNEYKDQEQPDENGVNVKGKGEWKRPLCLFPPYINDDNYTTTSRRNFRESNFIALGGFNFLSNIGKWCESRVERSREQT